MNKLHREHKMQLEESIQELRLSTIRGDLSAVETALRKGALCVDQSLRGGWSALMYACSLGHHQLVQYFIEKGANTNFHKELYTPLMAACASTNPDEDRLALCVEQLLAHSANINMAERHHMTALMFAAKEGHAKLVARLTSAKPPCNINAQDSQGWTALFWAVNKGSADVVDILLIKGARVEITDKSGSTAIALAQNKQLFTITEMLKRNHARPPDVPLLEKRLKPTISKKAETMLETFFGELSNNNNGRYNSSLSKLIKNMELGNNLEALVHGQVFSDIVHSVNGCLQKSIIPINKYSKSHEGKENSSVEMNWRNIPYSAVEAREVLSHMVRQLDAMYATMSYVRLRMQGNPPAAMVEDKYSRIAEINLLSDKALHYGRLLQDEIDFFRKYTRKLEERHPVPADLVVEQKTDNSHAKLISGCVIAASFIVVVWNIKFFNHPIFRF